MYKNISLLFLLTGVGLLQASQPGAPKPDENNKQAKPTVQPQPQGDSAGNENNNKRKIQFTSTQTNEERQEEQRAKEALGQKLEALKITCEEINAKIRPLLESSKSNTSAQVDMASGYWERVQLSLLHSAVIQQQQLITKYGKKLVKSKFSLNDIQNKLPKFEENINKFMEEAGALIDAQETDIQDMKGRLDVLEGKKTAWSDVTYKWPVGLSLVGLLKYANASAFALVTKTAASLPGISKTVSLFNSIPKVAALTSAVPVFCVPIAGVVFKNLADMYQSGREGWHKEFMHSFKVQADKDAYIANTYTKLKQIREFSWVFLKRSCENVQLLTTPAICAATIAFCAMMQVNK